MTAPAPAGPGWTDWPRRALAYQQPFRDRVAGVGLVAAAPASVAFVTASLLVSSLWHDPRGGRRLVAACCAWRAADLPGRSPLPLLGSALLVQRPVEALWTVAAVWLVLGPLEVAVGSRWLLAVAAGLATAEHLVAVAVGAAVAMAWSRRRRGTHPDPGPLDLLQRRGPG